MIEKMKSVVQARLDIIKEREFLMGQLMRHQLPLALAGKRPLPETDKTQTKAFDVKEAGKRIHELGQQFLQNSHAMNEFDHVDGVNALLICPSRPDKNQQTYWNNIVHMGMDKITENEIISTVNHSPLPTVVSLFDYKLFNKVALQYVLDILETLEIKTPVESEIVPVEETVSTPLVSFDYKEAIRLGKELNRMLFFTCIQQRDVIGAKIKPDTTDTERLTSLFGHPAIAVICGKIDYQSFASLFLDEDLRDTTMGYMAMGPCGTIFWYRENKFLNLFTLNDEPLSGKQVARYVAGYFNHDVAEKEIHG